MKRTIPASDWTAHPTVQAPVLEWLTLLAQTPVAMWAWGLSLMAGPNANQRHAASAQPAANTPRPQASLPAASPAAPPAMPHQRRSAVRLVAKPPLHAIPLLKSQRDVLTRLSTPERLDEVAGQRLQDLRSRKLSLCVLQVGIDGFEAVTTRYGRAAADHVLVQVAKRLRCLSPEENIMIEPERGEFTLLLNCPAGEGAASSRSMAARVIAELHRPLAYRTVSNLHIACCVGSALWPEDGATLNEVIRHASAALAEARCSGRGQARQYAGVDEAKAA